MLAFAYSEDLERSKAMGIAMGGLALGVLSIRNNHFIYNY